MKKSTKVTLLLAVILMVTGAIVALVCMVLGADLDDLTFSVDIPFIKESDKEADDQEWMDRVVDDKNADSWSFRDKVIVGLDVDIEAGTLVIQWSEQDECNIVVENGREGLRCELKDGVLIIEEDDSIDTLLDWSEFNTPRVVVTLPGKVLEEELLENIQISVGAGSVTVNQMVAKSLQVDVDAGSFVSENMLIRGNCDIDVSAGNVRIETGHITGDLQVDVDAGQVTYGGYLGDDWQVDVDAGSVTMELTNSLMDFNYQIQYDLGNVQLGDKVFDGLSNEQDLKYGASHDAQIQCDVGQVKVSFSK